MMRHHWIYILGVLICVMDEAAELTISGVFSSTTVLGLVVVAAVAAVLIWGGV